MQLSPRPARSPRPIRPHWQRFSAIAIAAGLLGAGCTPPGGGTGGTDGGTAGGLKLGALLPATGDLSSIGQPMLTVLPLLTETVNACGGVNGQPVSITTVDDQTDPTAGVEGMTKLTEVDKVAGVVGSFASSVSGAAVDVAVRNQVVMISPGSTSPIFTERAEKGDFNGYWARTAPPDTYQAQALAKLAWDRGHRRVATVVINNDYGVEFEQKFVAAYKALGGTVVNETNPTRYDPKASTFETEARAAFGAKPDAVAAILYAETGALLLKSAYEQGLTEDVQIMLTDGVKTEEFPAQVGKTASGDVAIAGAIGTVPGADGAGLEKLAALLQEKLGSAPGAFVPQTWDAAALLMLAAQAAGENTGPAIQSKLREVANGPGTPVTDVCEGLAALAKGEDIDFQGASGNVDIDEKGDVVGNYDVWTVQPDGKIAVTDRVKLQ